jgi:hypothetical protein
MRRNSAHVARMTPGEPAELYTSSQWMHCYRTAMLHDAVRHTHHWVAFAGDVPPFTEGHAPELEEMP